MAVRAVTVGIVLVLLIAFCVYIVEMFIMLSAKSDMNLSCRKALIAMEISGGLDEKTEEALKNSLRKCGFENIRITGTRTARHGEELELLVEADYRLSRLSGLFTRQDTNEPMVYHRITTSRKVVN